MQKINEIHILKSTRKIINVDGVPTEHISHEEVFREVNTTHPGLRFLHYIIDMFGFFAFAMVGFVLIFLFGGDEYFWTEGAGLYLLTYGGWFLYYSVLEGFWGWTLGKLVTGSRVVNEYGKPPGLGKAMLRSICRFIPFEALSCFGHRGWHDSIAKTFVIPRKERLELIRIMENDGQNQFPEQGSPVSQDETF